MLRKTATDTCDWISRTLMPLQTTTPAAARWCSFSSTCIHQFQGIQFSSELAGVCKHRATYAFLWRSSNLYRSSLPGRLIRISLNANVTPGSHSENTQSSRWQVSEAEEFLPRATEMGCVVFRRWSCIHACLRWWVCGIDRDSLCICVWVCARTCACEGHCETREGWQLNSELTHDSTTSTHSVLYTAALTEPNSHFILIPLSASLCASLLPSSIHPSIHTYIYPPMSS